MKISFFEEFPTKENLSKLKLINFPSKLYLASQSLKEFYKIKTKNKRIELAYWPLLKKEEGYWISPWSKTAALKRIFNELIFRKDTRQLFLLLDLEPPFTKPPFLTRPFKMLNLIKFTKNKKLIRDFIKNSKKYNLEITTAENAYFPTKLLQFLALSINTEKNPVNRIVMIYKKDISKLLQKIILKETNNNIISKTFIGLGCIATGVLENEAILTPEELKNNLEICKKHNIKEVIIFRLGGLTKQYLRVIKEINND